MITFDEYEPKPTLDTILSSYSRENETFFRFKVMESYARGTKFTCKLCKANIEKPLMRLHVAKHIFQVKFYPVAALQQGNLGQNPT